MDLSNSSCEVCGSMTGNLAGTIGALDQSSGPSDGNAGGVGFGFEDTGIEAHALPGNCNLGAGTPAIWEV